MGLLSTVLGIALYALISARIWQAATAARLPHRWLAFVPVVNFAVVFRLAGWNPLWVASIVVPPAFAVALLAALRGPAERDGTLGWWWLSLVAVAGIPVALVIELAGGQATLGTLGLNLARLLLAFGLWEMLRPWAVAPPRRRSEALAT